VIKYIVIGIFAAIAILDILLILGCAKMERERDDYERSRQISDR